VAIDAEDAPSREAMTIADSRATKKERLNDGTDDLHDDD
jgi:hypothetical protein